MAPTKDIRQLIPKDLEFSTNNSVTRAPTTDRQRRDTIDMTNDDDPEYSESPGADDHGGDEEWRPSASSPVSTRASSRAKAKNYSTANSQNTSQSQTREQEDPQASNGKRPRRHAMQEPKELSSHQKDQLIHVLKNSVAELKHQLEVSRERTRKEIKIKDKHWARLQDKKETSENLAAKQANIRIELQQALADKKVLAQRLGQDDRVIQAWQDRAFAQATSGFHNDTDDVIGQVLRSLFRAVEGWVKQYAAKDWKSIDLDHRRAIGKALTDSDKPNIASKNAIMATLYGRLPPKVVAAAIVNRDLVCATLAGPFQILGRSPLLSTLQDSAKTLEQIHAALCSVADTTAAKFRCTAMTLLRPPDEVGMAAIVRSHDTANFAEEYAQQLAITIVPVLTPLLELDEGGLAKAELEFTSIAKRFISASIGCNSQLPYTYFEFLDPLAEEKFDCPHDLLDPHPTLSICPSSDEDGYGRTAHEAGILGAAPDLVVRPLVLRSGDEQGDNWHMIRPAVTALVWIRGPVKAQAQRPEYPQKPKGSSQSAKGDVSAGSGSSPHILNVANNAVIEERTECSVQCAARQENLELNVPTDLRKRKAQDESSQSSHKVRVKEGHDRSLNGPSIGVASSPALPTSETTTSLKSDTNSGRSRGQAFRQDANTPRKPTVKQEIVRSSCGGFEIQTIKVEDDAKAQGPT